MKKLIIALCILSLFLGLMFVLGWPNGSGSSSSTSSLGFSSSSSANKNLTTSDKIGLLGGSITSAGQAVVGAKVTIEGRPVNPKDLMEAISFRYSAYSNENGAFTFKEDIPLDGSQVLYYTVEDYSLPADRILVDPNGYPIYSGEFTLLDLKNPVLIDENEQTSLKGLTLVIEDVSICGEASSFCGDCVNVNCAEGAHCNCCNDSVCSKVPCPAGFSCKSTDQISSLQQALGLEQSVRASIDLDHLGHATPDKQVELSGQLIRCQITIQSWSGGVCGPCERAKAWAKGIVESNPCVKFDEGEKTAPAPRITITTSDNSLVITGFNEENQRTLEAFITQNCQCIVDHHCSCNLDETASCKSFETLLRGGYTPERIAQLPKCAPDAQINNCEKLLNDQGKTCRNRGLCNCKEDGDGVVPYCHSYKEMPTSLLEQLRNVNSPVCHVNPKEGEPDCKKLLDEQGRSCKDPGPPVEPNNRCKETIRELEGEYIKAHICLEHDPEEEEVTIKCENVKDCVSYIRVCSNLKYDEQGNPTGATQDEYRCVLAKQGYDADSGKPPDETYSSHRKKCNQYDPQGGENGEGAYVYDSCGPKRVCSDMHCDKLRGTCQRTGKYRCTTQNASTYKAHDARCQETDASGFYNYDDCGPPQDSSTSGSSSSSKKEDPFGGLLEKPEIEIRPGSGAL